MVATRAGSLMVVAATISACLAGGATTPAEAPIKVGERVLTLSPEPMMIGEKLVGCTFYPESLPVLDVRGNWVKVTHWSGDKQETGWVHRKSLIVAGGIDDWVHWLKRAELFRDAPDARAISQVEEIRSQSSQEKDAARCGQLLARARDVVIAATVKALQATCPRTDGLPKEGFPAEAPPGKSHDVKIATGSPVAAHVASLGPPYSQSLGLLRWHSGMSVGFGWAKEKYSLGLVTGVQVREPFAGCFYGIRLGDTGEAVVERWGQPYFAQGRYRLWSLGQHKVELLVEVRDGKVVSIATRYWSKPSSLIMYDKNSGYPWGPNLCP